MLRVLLSGILLTTTALAATEKETVIYTLPPLPYAKDARAPTISAETIEYHYGKHHQAYVDNLNKLVPGTPFEGKTLEQIVAQAQGPIFNNAAQVWNHTFYWQSLKPKGGGEPSGALAETITKSCGSFASFQEQFTKAAIGQFGSGWAWWRRPRLPLCLCWNALFIWVVSMLLDRSQTSYG